MASNRSVQEQDELDLHLQLSNAAAEGNIPAIKKAIQAGAKVNDFFFAPLAEAAKHNHVDAMKLLLEAGASIDNEDTLSSTPLSIVVFSESKDAVKFLLEAGADVNARNSHLQQTPLHIAHEIQDTAPDNIVNMLLAAGAKPELKDKWNRTCVDTARNNKFIYLADYLQSIIDNPSLRPTMESAGLDMDKRILALEALGRPLGQFTQAERRRLEQRKTREAQRREALDSPFGGI